MASLQDLISGINSGAVDVSGADNNKRQPTRKPKAQSDLQKRLRGSANAVNNSAVAAPAPKPAAERRQAARPTPPPAGAASPGRAAAPSAAAAAGAAAAAAGPVSIEGLPRGMRLKKVLDTLRANRDPHSFSDLRAKLGVDLNIDTELLEDLQGHTQVSYNSLDQTFRYRPKLQGINNANDLLNYLRRHTTVEGASAAVPMSGVKVSDVEDAYITIMDDIKRLAAEGSIYVFGHTNPGCDTLYAVQPMNIGPVSESVVELFHKTPLPIDIIDLQVGAV